MYVIWLGTASASTCDTWAEPRPLASVTGAGFDEASGIAASRTRDGVWFLHGDNNDEAVVAAVDRQGRVVDQHRITDARNEDWEDLSSAPCPDDGACLYIGDIGDNDELRPNITVYVVREPEAGDAKLKSIRRYVGVYPDGPHDAEGLMVDPCTGRIHVITKEDPALVFAFPFDPEDTVTLEPIAELRLQGPTADTRLVTGADWDVDGDRFVLRGSDREYVWTVDPFVRESTWAMTPLEIVGTTEVQGEGVCFGTDGAMYTTGEGVPIPLSVIECDDPTGGGPAEDVCVFPQTGRSCGCQTQGGGGLLGGLLALAALRRGRR